MGVEELWSLLISHHKLDRDRGIEKVQQETAINSSPDIQDLIQKLEGYSITQDDPWETKLGILDGSKAVLPAVCENTFLACCMSRASTLLTDPEVRVRLAAGQLIGSLCQVQGIAVFDDCKPLILGLIRDNLDRQHEGDETVVVGSSQAIFHETAGWRNLETSVKCLQCIVEGCTVDFASRVTQDPEILNLIFVTTEHTNRFVRETGYYTLASIIQSCTGSGDDAGIYLKFGQSLTKRLAQGMADNWSQVRLASTTAARHFLVSLPPNLPSKHELHALLLPPICLNRYYLAEGVRIYSQETWKLVTSKEEGGGRQVVVNHIQNVVGYYVQCTKADNHAVRESACQCIAELASKIDVKVLHIYVDQLLDTLVECFKDDSWPVRDMACVAAGKFVLSYPTESERCKSSLESLFFDNLHDPIPSVRQGGALALANLVRAYGLSDSFLDRINQALDGVKDQPATTGPTIGGEAALGQFGVAKKARDNDFALHEDQVMFSCGSLAPKMSRGGCSDCKFKRDSELWEMADGAVYLVSELSAIDDCKPRLTSSILKMAGACRHRQYVAHFTLIETVMKTLPIIAENLGKRNFKAQFLEEFFDAMFYAVDSQDHALAAAAGSACVSSLSDLIGRNIFRGRVEQYNPRYLNLLDSCLVDSYIPGRSIPVPMDTSERRPSLGGTPTNSPK